MNKLEINVTLGKGIKGLKRKTALLLWAGLGGHFWGGRPSISKAMQRLADEIITTPEKFGLTSNQIEEKMNEEKIGICIEQ